MPGTTRYSATLDNTYEEAALDRPPSDCGSSSTGSLEDGATYSRQQDYPWRYPAYRHPWRFKRQQSASSGDGNIPTRSNNNLTTSKPAYNPLQFIKVGPAHLAQKAQEQMKKVQDVKEVKKFSREESEEWQEIVPQKPLGDDWQTNLDNWKCARRKRVEDVIERVQEIKHYEHEGIEEKTRRKSKTFSEMMQERNSRGSGGKKFNLSLYTEEDDSGFSYDSKSFDEESNGRHYEGSSDDTASKDSLELKPKVNGESKVNGVNGDDQEYTFQKAIDTYVNYANSRNWSADSNGSTSHTSSDKESENSEGDQSKSHSRTSSVDSKSQRHTVFDTRKHISNYVSETQSQEFKSKVASFNSGEVSQSSSEPSRRVSAPARSEAFQRKLASFNSGDVLEKDVDEKITKVDVHKPEFQNIRNNFEKQDVSQTQVKKITPDRDTAFKSKRQSFVSQSIKQVEVKKIKPERDSTFKTKLASFSEQNLSSQQAEFKKIHPERDTSFKTKLAAFSEQNVYENPVAKIIPERDTSFKNKLANFNSIEGAKTKLSPSRSMDIGKNFPINEPVSLEKRAFERTQSLGHLPELNLSDSSESETEEPPTRRMSLPSQQSLQSQPKPSVEAEQVSDGTHSSPSTLSPVPPSPTLKHPATTGYQEIDFSHQETEPVITKTRLACDTQDDDDDVEDDDSSDTEAMFQDIAAEAIKSKSKIPKKIHSSPSKLPTSQLKTQASPKRSQISPSKVSTSPSKTSTSPSKIPTSSTKTPTSPSKVPTSSTKLQISPSKIPTSQSKLSTSPAKISRSGSGDIEKQEKYINKTPERAESEKPDKPEDRLDTLLMFPVTAPPSVQEPQVKKEERLLESVPLESEIKPIVSKPPLPQPVDEAPIVKEKVTDRRSKTFEEFDSLNIVDDDLEAEMIILSEETPKKHEEDSSSCESSVVLFPKGTENILAVDLDEASQKLLVGDYLMDSPLDLENVASKQPPKEKPPPPPPIPENSELDQQQQSSPVIVHERTSSKELKKDLWRRRSDFLGLDWKESEEYDEQIPNPPSAVEAVIKAERKILQESKRLNQPIKFEDFSTSRVPTQKSPASGRRSWVTTRDAYKPVELKQSVIPDTNIKQKHQSDTWGETQTDPEQARIQSQSDYEAARILSHVDSETQSIQSPHNDHQQATRTRSQDDDLLRLRSQSNPHAFRSTDQQCEFTPYATFDKVDDRISYQPEAYNEPLINQYDTGHSELGIPYAEDVESQINNTFMHSHSEKPYEYELPYQRNVVQENSHSAFTTYNPQYQQYYEEDKPEQQIQGHPNYTQDPYHQYQQEPQQVYQENHHFHQDQTRYYTDSVQYQERYRVEPAHVYTSEDNLHEIIDKGVEAYLQPPPVPAKPPRRHPDGEKVKKKKDINKHWIIQEAEQRRIEEERGKQRSNQHLPLQKASSDSRIPIQPLYVNQQYPTTPTHNYSNIQVEPLHKYNNNNVQTGSPLQSYGTPVVEPLTSPTQRYNIQVEPLNNYNIHRDQPPQQYNAAIDNADYVNLSAPHRYATGHIHSSSVPVTSTTAPVPAPNTEKALPDSVIKTITQRVHTKQASNNSLWSSPVYENLPYGNGTTSPAATGPPMLSVSGKKKCSSCSLELGRGAAMIIESLRLFYHLQCFRCCVCNQQLGNGTAGADVRVRNNRLHCHNCYSNDQGLKFSKV